MRPPIAIVGTACRYPDARSPKELWENVLAGRRAFRPLPPERLRLDDYREDREGTDSTYAREAAVLTDWEFDRVRFRVAGGTYRAADLAHWLALEVAADALEDAGLPLGEGLNRETVGVVVGNSLTGEFSRASLMRLRWPYVRRTLAEALRQREWSGEDIESFLADYEGSYKEPFEPMGEESLAGGLANTIAGRIANFFDLGGGGFTVDGACSSSLLAVAQGASRLAAGEIDGALVGGVDLSLDPFELVGFARTGALTRGDMKVYDRRSAGFIPGEGCGFLMMMRLEDAEARGLEIKAVLRGWGIASDGAGGITRPEPQGQLRALEAAYRGCDFGPESVGLFEGHGTGTAVGDAVEIEALSLLRRRAQPEGKTEGGKENRVQRQAALGSIKANIGHTKAAAGVAGLLKAIEAVRHAVLPPTTGTDEPHELLMADDVPLRVLDTAEAWPSGPRRAAVSAMGFGGINAHVVVEGAESRPASSRRGFSASKAKRLAGSSQDAELLVFSGGSPQELLTELSSLRPLAESLSRSEIGDLAAELARRSGSDAWRAALVVDRSSNLVAGLDRLLEALGEVVAGPGSSPNEARERHGSGLVLFDLSWVYFCPGPIGQLRLGLASCSPGKRHLRVPSEDFGNADSRRSRSCIDRLTSMASLAFLASQT